MCQSNAEAAILRFSSCNFDIVLKNAAAHELKDYSNHVAVLPWNINTVRI